MKKFIIGLIIGLAIGTAVTAIAASKFESGSSDAASVVGYGYKTATAIQTLKVSSDGTVYIQ